MDSSLTEPFAIIATLTVAIATIYYVFMRKERKSIEVIVPKNIPQKKQKKDTVRVALVKPEVLTICDGRIHVAIGYGLANAIILEGEEGCVLIDTMESNDTAQGLFAYDVRN